MEMLNDNLLESILVEEVGLGTVASGLSPSCIV